MTSLFRLWRKNRLRKWWWCWEEEIEKDEVDRDGYNLPPSSLVWDSLCEQKTFKILKLRFWKSEIESPLYEKSLRHLRLLSILSPCLLPGVFSFLTNIFTLSASMNQYCTGRWWLFKMRRNFSIFLFCFFFVYFHPFRPISCMFSCWPLLRIQHVETPFHSIFIFQNQRKSTIVWTIKRIWPSVQKYKKITAEVMVIILWKRVWRSMRKKESRLRTGNESSHCITFKTFLHPSLF